MVFLHGVYTRRIDGNPSYEKAVATRDRRFIEHAFKGSELKVVNPYWGDHGADPQWGLRSIPKILQKYQALNLGLDIESQLKGHILLDAAREDFPAVVSALSIVAIDEAESSGNAATLAEAEQLWTGAALYAAKRPKPPWIAAVKNDEQFLTRLRQEAAATVAVQDLGVVDWVKKAGAKLAGTASNIVNGPIAYAAREKLSPHIAIFAGDVFRYLKEGPSRTAIRRIVIDAIVEAARSAAEAGEKLVLAGHSMGGVILYDLLSDPGAIAEMDAGLGSQLQVDLFLSVGSQIALFEELKVFAASDNAHSGITNKAPRPPRAALWWNVFDKMDVLSFVADPVFEDVSDLAVDTVAGVLSAHGAYFDNMVFYNRLNTRLREAGLVP